LSTRSAGQTDIVREEEEKGGRAMARWLFLGLLMGGLIGASAALLLAPGRGAETRRLVRSRAEPAVSRVRHVAARLAKRDDHPPDEDEPEEIIWAADVYRYQ
jgi:hypothetical protein